jgi:hypothetical protein
MVVLPLPTPVTMPVDVPTVATLVVLLVQVPPVTLLERVIVDPAQTVAVPVMVPAVGAVLTVTVNVAVAVPQLVDTV